MADIFLSYSREDGDRAAQLAQAFGTRGWSVWWDRNIIAGQTFDRVIEHELASAKCVVVLWSKNSIESEWVKNEASASAERGVLVPAMIESVRLPLEFRRKQTADLVDWSGDPAHNGYQALCAGVLNVIGGALREQPLLIRRDRRWILAAGIAVTVAVGVGIYFSGPWRAATVQASESQPSPGTATGPADRVTGRYSGDVVADTKGFSRSDIDVTITKVDRYTVRITSDYRRIGTVEITLTRIGNRMLNSGGDTALLMNLDQNPLVLEFSPRGELTYRGTRQ